MIYHFQHQFLHNWLMNQPQRQMFALLKDKKKGWRREKKDLFALIPLSTVEGRNSIVIIKKAEECGPIREQNSSTKCTVCWIPFLGRAESAKARNSRRIFIWRAFLSNRRRRRPRKSSFLSYFFCLIEFWINDINCESAGWDFCSLGGTFLVLLFFCFHWALLMGELFFSLLF